jgi:uncharacterized protein (DUF924 family)
MNDAEAILAFWYAEGRDTYRPIWFQKNDAFDAEIRDRFGALIRPAREGALDSWAETPTGALALLILLDQFPRNVLRGSAEAFASDAHARAIARVAVLEERFDLKLGSYEKPFVYLPFEHSESLADQDLSVALFEGLRDIPHHARENGAIDYAWRHRVVIQQFGRFPHRNAALGRESTPAEEAWLDAGGGF